MVVVSATDRNRMAFEAARLKKTVQNHHGVLGKMVPAIAEDGF